MTRTDTGTSGCCPAHGSTFVHLAESGMRGSGAWNADVDDQRSGPSGIVNVNVSDGFAISLVVLVILNIGVHHHLFDDWLGSTDRIAFFMPMFSFMGERLGAGDIPGWNPYTLSGVPFAGDPESGWLYFPAFHERTDPELPLLQGDLRWVGFSPLRPARCPLHHRGCPDPGRP